MTLFFSGGSGLTMTSLLFSTCAMFGLFAPDDCWRISIGPVTVSAGCCLAWPFDFGFDFEDGMEGSATCAGRFCCASAFGMSSGFFSAGCSNEGDWTTPDAVWREALNLWSPQINAQTRTKANPTASP